MHSRNLIVLATVVYMIVHYTPACFSTFYQSTIIPTLFEKFLYTNLTFFAKYCLVNCIKVMVLHTPVYKSSEIVIFIMHL